MARFLNGVLCVFLILTLGPGKGRAEELPLSAASAILMDRESRRILWEKDSHQIRPMASVTKIMTALLALELGDQEETVKISSAAAHTRRLLDLPRAG